MSNRILISTTLIILSVGCGKFQAVDSSSLGSSISLSTRPLAACDRKNVVTINLCTEVLGSVYNDQAYLDIFASSCESTGGTVSTNICDRTNSFGTCVIYPNQSNETRVAYYPPQYTAETAQAACEGTTGGVYLSN